MSMTRTDALTQLSSIRKFEGLTAGELLATEWAGLRGLAAADLAYFRLHADKPAKVGAQACHGRSLARTIDPLVS